MDEGYFDLVGNKDFVVLHPIEIPKRTNAQQTIKGKDLFSSIKPIQSPFP
jgi:hypothetical protein